MDKKTKINLIKLIDKTIDHTISSSEMEEIKAILKKSRRAREYFIRYTEIHTILNLHHSNLKRDNLIIGSNIFNKRDNPQRLRKVLLTAASFAFIVGTLLFWSISNYMGHKNITSNIPVHKQTPKPEQSISAKVASSKKTSIPKTKKTARTGKWMNSGKVEIEKDTVEIPFDSGALVLLEGPASFSILGKNKGRLHKGKLTAYVPEKASGFILETPVLTITDLGTRFAVNIKNESEAEILVKEGNIEINAHNKSRIINEKNACSIDANSETIFEETEYNENKYIFNINHERTTETINEPVKNDEFINDGASNNTNNHDNIIKCMHMKFDTIENKVYYANENNVSSRAASGKLFDLAGTKYLNNNERNSFISTGIFEKAFFQNTRYTALIVNYDGMQKLNEKSILFWVKLSLKRSNHYQPVISWATKDSIWLIGITSMYNGNLFIENTSGSIQVPTASIADNKWHHIGIIFSGNTDNEILDNAKIYIDGIFNSYVRKDSDDHHTLQNKAYPIKTLVVGNHFKKPDKNENINANHLWLDELFIFNLILSQNEIINIKNKNEF